MSDLVFVRDAQGRPLMPMSAAYARTLVNQGKAQVWPHPAFSVIQLTRVVGTPTLRPVLVGLALSTTIADLVVVVDQVRSAPSTVQVAVDLRSSSSLRSIHHARLGPCRRRILPARAGTYQRPRDRVHLLVAVLKIWQEVVPISHLVLLPSARTTALTPPSVRWIEQQLVAQVCLLNRTIAIVHRHTKISGEAPYTLMQQLIDQTIWAARQSPQFVACAAGKHRSLHYERRYPSHGRWKQRNQAALHMTSDPYVHYLGQLCTVRFQRRTLTGVVQVAYPTEHLVLKVPSLVDDRGVQWQLTDVPLIPSLQVWPSTPIWLLPLPKKEGGDSDQRSA